MAQVNKQNDGFALIILAVFIGNFLAFVNSGTVNIALPSMMKNLHTNINSVQWIVTGFMLAIGTIAPVVGFLGAKLGYKKVYITALIGLTASSALCGLSWNIGSLISFRVLQGICAGMIQISTMTIIYQSVSKEKQSMAISLWTVSMMVAPAVGPTVGGMITHAWGWRALFYANVPIGVIAILCAILCLPARKDSAAVTLDFWGLLAVAAGNVSLLMYFTKGSDWGWFSVPALALLLTGLVGIAAFIWRELTAKEPLLNLRVFQYPKYAMGTILNCFISVGLYSSVFLIPLFLEEAQGASSFTSGLIMLPGALIMILVTMATGKLYGKFDPVWFVLFGVLLLCIASWEFSRLTMHSSIGYVMIWMILRYIGVGLATSPVTNISMSHVPAEHVGSATSISNWLRQAVAALAIAIFSSILAVRTGAHLAELGGERVGEALKQAAFLYGSNDTFLVSTAVLVFAIPLSLLLGRRTVHE
ncbi:MDR family MFS transporter [Paenibacillus ihumii]|uniref:MDR family MFS transporter n=1 Tax=Paenibacillus ihumii TaxID=687436 RepID=UPI0006D7B924|nr:MDR family MFS transporter [Paenibacillus ihumii]